MADTPGPVPQRRGSTIVGLIVMAVGIVLLLERTEALHVDFSPQLWPVIPLVIGLLRMVNPPASPEGRRHMPPAGSWLVFIGCWGLLNEFRVFGLDYDISWPLVVVFAGVTIVWRALEGSNGANAAHGGTP
jgi:hypothetical protein